MSNLQAVLEKYKNHPRCQDLMRALQTEQARVLVDKTKGGQEAFVFAATAKKLPKTHLYITNTKEDAAYLLNDMSDLVGEEHTLFFPDSFKRPASYDAIKSEQVLERSQTVSKISEKPTTDNRQPTILITYPEAVFEKVVSPAALNENRIHLKVGETMDVDTVMELLIEYGFERVDFVFEPGHFSLRGGIVDLFSYGADLPYRIELFDEEVESIRLFDPLTQLSKRNISKVSIVPNLNTRFKREQKVSIFEILPEDTVVWMQNYQILLDRLQYCFDRIDHFSKELSSLESGELRELFRDQAFLFPKDIIQGVKSMPVVFTEKSGITDNLGGKDLKTIEFRAQPQPSFNKNFSLLIDFLKEKAEEGYENHIFTDNPKQINRLKAIFKDLNAHISFNPVIASLKEGFLDEDLKIVCLTDHQIFHRFKPFRLKTGFTKEQALNVRLIKDLQVGDFVTHIDHGVGRFSGLEKIDIGGKQQEAVRLIYKNNDILYVSIHSLHKITKYVGKEGTTPQLNKLGSDAWQQVKNRTKRQIKDIAAELIKLYAKRKAADGFAFSEDGYMQNELEASFIYEDTPDQSKATQDVKDDMEKPTPMDRLICGDVGFGKTEVAVRAAFKAVTDGKQVAILVPTTILALQHYRTFKERLVDFPVEINYLNRFKTAKEKREIMEQCKSGKIDIIIGTHALLNKDMGFKDLGLLIVDEEQKFGVKAKEQLRSMRHNVDTLTLTATPIPRTLQFSLMAARDLSVINTPPPNRQPIHTEIRVFDQDLIKDAIYYEVHRGGQVFFVHNRVNDLPKIADMIKRLCPDLDVVAAHGQMEPKALEATLVDFIDRRYEVLICTNIIETGLDIPSANTMIINRADMFGLSDLHQLRGRVGRSNVKAFCYLLAPPLSSLTPEARKRLRTIEEFSELGSGFNVAMRDMDIRGAGNLLGGEQSGFISDIGYETYQKILDEAIQELKDNEFSDVFKDEIKQKRSFVRDVTIETDIEMLIPDDYVTNTQERLSLYSQLDEIEDENGVAIFTQMLQDRFGNKMPKQVFNLFDALRLRWLCKQLGFERLILKQNKLLLFFIQDPQSNFYETAHFRALLTFIQKHGRQMGLSFKQTRKDFYLVQEQVRTVEQAKKTLEGLVKALGV